MVYFGHGLHMCAMKTMEISFFPPIVTGKMITAQLEIYSCFNFLKRNSVGLEYNNGMFEKLIFFQHFTMDRHKYRAIELETNRKAFITVYLIS